jgi:hypothetical protein
MKPGKCDRRQVSDVPGHWCAERLTLCSICVSVRAKVGRSIWRPDADFPGWLSILFVIMTIPQVTISAPDDEAAAPAQNAAANPRFNNFEQVFNNIEANVFQPHGSAKQARTHLDARLKLQIDELHRTCDLTDEQQQKLRLAGINDIRRFFAEFEALRKKYQTGKKDQDAWNNFWQEVQPLQTKMAGGLFGANSFFAKSIRNVLRPDQVVKYDELVLERRQFHYRACIEATLETVEQSVPLREEQSSEIVRLMLEETSPPLVFGRHDHQIVMYNLTKVSEAKLKALLDERQWKRMQAQLNQNRGWEQWLMQQGLLPQADGEAKLSKVRIRRQIRRADAEVPENGAAAKNKGIEQ